MNTAPVQPHLPRSAGFPAGTIHTTTTSKAPNHLRFPQKKTKSNEANEVDSLLRHPPLATSL